MIDNYIYTPFVLPLTGAALTTTLLMILGFRRINNSEAPPFIALMAAVTMWSIFYMMEVLGGNVTTKVLWAKLQYIPITLSPLLWFIIALRYTGRSRLVRYPLFKILYFFPILTIVIAFTNAPGGIEHHLIWKSVSFVPEDPFPALEITHGPWFWVHVLYSYPLMFGGTLLFMSFALRARNMFAGQGIAIMIGAIAPWLGNAIYLSGMSSNVDFTPFSFTITGIALSWGFFRYQFLTVAPLARDLVIESMPDGLIVVDDNFTVVDINRSAVDIIGLSARQKVIGTKLDDLLKQFPSLLETSKDEFSGQREVLVNGGSGNRYFLVSKSQIKREWKKKKIPGSVILFREITDIKLTQLELAKSESIFRAVFENATDGIFIKDRNLRYTRVNDAMCGLLGLPPEMIIESTDWELAEKTDDKAGFHDDRIAESKVLEGDIIQEETERIIEGKKRIFHTIKVPIRDETGEISGLCGISRDITERKLLERERDIMFSRVNAVMNTVPEGLVLLDENMTILAANSAASRYLELLTNSKVGDTLIKIGPVFLEEFRSGDNVAERREIRLEVNGVERIYEVSTYGMTEYPAGGSMVLVIEDVTEEVSMRKRLNSQDRLAAIGQLAGGVAHDFNNLLTVILGYADMLVNQLDERDPLRADLEAISRAGERATALTGQLLAFSRRQMLRPKILDLNRIVSEMETMLHRLIGEDIELITILDPEIRMVKADSSQLEQVIMNLVVNARDALLPNGGKIVMETSNLYVDESFAKLEPELEPGEYISLIVSDTGRGMSEEVMGHIFEPFFTTKAQKGTGLGLSTVYGIVKQSGGHISVFSKVGEGTTFRILLPVAEGHAEEVNEAEEQRKEEFLGSETILVVEDDPDVRKLAVITLEDLGYTVYSAENGEDAIKFIESTTSSIDLLVTDVIMPRMGGYELVKEVSRMYPGIKIMYMSGYTDSSVIHHEIISSGEMFLQKPFTSFMFSRAVRKVLDGQI